MPNTFHSKRLGPNLSAFLFLSFCIYSTCAVNVYFSKGDLTVFAQTDYTFQIEPDTPIPAGEVVSVTFSTGYMPPNGPLTNCILNNSTLSGCACSGLVCTIPMPKIATVQTLSLEIGPVTNPGEANSVTFIISSNSLGTNTISGTKLSEGVITILSATVASPKVQATTNYTITFQLTNPIPAGGSLTVKFPSTSTDQIVPSTDTVILTYAYNGSSITATASPSDDKVTITAPFTVVGYSYPSSSITINLNNIQNPQTVGTSGEIQLRTLSKAGKGINSGVFKVSITQAGTTTVQSVAETGSKIINAISQIALSFKFDINFVDTSSGPYYYVSVDLPSGFIIQDSLICTRSGGLVTPNTAGLSPTCQKYTNNTLWLVYVIYNSPNSPTTLTVTGIKNPSSTQLLQTPVNVSVYQSSSTSLTSPGLIATGSYSWTYSATPGNLTINSISRSANSLGSAVSLTFDFTLPDSIAVGAGVIIQIPKDQVNFTSTPTCERIISGMSISMPCTMETQDSSFRLIATLCQTAAICTAGTEVIVSIHDNTFNPSYIRLTQIDSIQIYTKTSDGIYYYHTNLVNLYLTPSLVPTVPTNINYKKTGPGYQIVDKPFVLSVAFTPNPTVLTGGYVYLYFPSQAIYAENISLVECNYQDNGVVFDSDTCIITQDSANSSIIMIGMPICTGLSNACVPPITFTVDGLQNPSNTKPIVTDSSNFWAMETGLSSTQRIDYKILTSELPDTTIIPNAFTINTFVIGNKIVSQPSNVTLAFTVATPIPSNDILDSRIIITLPATVNLATDASSYCNAVILPSTALTCTPNTTASPNTIVITQDTANSEIAEDSEIQVIVSVINPPNTKTTESFTLESVSRINSTDYPLDTYDENNLNIVASPNTFTGYSLTVDPPTVGATAKNIFTFIPSTSIPPASQYNSRIVIELPTTMAFLSLSNPPACSASAPSISLTCTYQTTTSPQSILLSHSQASAALGGTPITVTVPSGVLQNPSSTQPTNSIILTSLSTISSKDYTIDQLTTGFINDQVNQPAAITSYSAWKNSSKTQKYTDLSLSFVPVHTLSSATLISVSLPKEQVLLSSTLANLHVSYQGNLIAIYSSAENDTSIDFSLQTPCDPCPSNISFVLTGLINPNDAIAFNQSISLTTETLAGNYLIDAVTSNFFSLPNLTSGSLTNITVTSSSWVVGTSAQLTISFVSNTALSSQADVNITFSDNTYFDSGNGVVCKNGLTQPMATLMCAPEYGTSSYPNPVSSIDILLNVLCKSTCPKGTSFTIVLQGLRNAFAVTSSAATLTISTSDQGLSLDSGLINLRSLSPLLPGNLSVLQMQRSVSLVGKQTQLQIGIQTATLMTPSHQFLIDFSQSYQLILDPATTPVCSLINPSTQQLLRTLSCSNPQNNSVIISNLCQDTSCAGGLQYYFTIQGLKNVDYVEPSLNTTSTILMRTSDQNGFTSDQVNGIVQVAPVLMPNSLTLIKSSISDRTVQLETEWDLTVGLATSLHTSSVLVIEFPEHTLYNDTSSFGVLCLFNSTQQVQCDTEMYENTDYGIQTITFREICGTLSSCQSGNSLPITIQGIANPSVIYNDSSNITVRTKNPDPDGNLQDVDILSNLWVTLLGPLVVGKINVKSFSENLPHPGVLTNLTVIFSNTIPSAQNDQVVMTLPQIFVIPDFVEAESKCQSIAGFTSSLQCRKQGNQLILTNGFAVPQEPSIFAFTLLNVLNPTNQTKASSNLLLRNFLITILNSQGLLKETSSNFNYLLTPLDQDLVCDSNCLTCVNSSSTCTSCNVPSQFPILSNNTCTNSCPSGFTIGVGTCVPCYTGCSDCSGSNDNQCLACESPLVMLDGKCVSECPANTIYNSTLNACVNKANCTNGCSICSETSSFCLACTAPNILDPETRTCIDPSATSCSAPYYYDSVSHKCMPCSSECSSCQSSSTNCTSCSSQFLPVLNTTTNTCEAECPASTFLNSDNKCVSCNSSCLTCSGPSNTDCTSCPSTQNPYLEYGQCVPACSPNYIFNTQLQQCVLPCTDTNCYKCQEADLNTCVECKEKFFLDGTVCSPVGSCPDGQYFSSGSQTCQSCNPSCKTCSGSAGNCTSCYTDYTYPTTIDPNKLEFLYNGKCLQTCPLGYSADFSHDKVCEPYECLAPCEFCSGASTKCYTCLSSDPYLFNDYCYSTCPSGSTASTDSKTNELICQLNVISQSLGFNITWPIVILIIATALATLVFLALNILSRIKKFPIHNRDTIIVLMQTLEVLSKLMLIPNVWEREEGFLFFSVFTLMFNMIIGINFNVLYLPVYESYVPTVKNYMQLNKKTGKMAKAMTYIGGSNMTNMFKSGLTGHQAQFEKIGLFKEIQQKHAKIGLIATAIQALISIIILATTERNRDAFGIAVFNLVYNLVIIMGFLTEFLKGRIFKKTGFLKKESNTQAPPQTSH